MIKKKLVAWLLRLLDKSLVIDYTKIDNKKGFEDWAFRSVDDAGWRSYLAYEDLRLLKELGIPKHDFEYWMIMGKRIQLLSLADEMRKAFMLKKSAEEKRKAEAEKNNNK